MKNAYFDNSATTRVDPRVQEVLLRTFRDVYGNPSSPHAEGRNARRVIDDAREQVATALGTEDREIIFTSGATEANNLVFRGIRKRSGKQILTTQIEHPSVLEVVSDLEKEGWTIGRVSVNKEGCIDPEELHAGITSETSLVSVMWANNEVGSIQPIPRITLPEGCLLHSDAAQALGKTALSVEGVDYLTLSGHKVHGPKGIGALYCRKGSPLEPLIIGGGQEFQKRGGTENVALIAGFAKAVSLAVGALAENQQKMEKIRQRILSSVQSCSDVSLLGASRDRLPNIINLCFEGVDAEALVLALDAEGVYVSSGSACASLSTEPSHVLLAMGLDLEEAKTSVRISLAADTTEAEVVHLTEKLPATVARLRRYSERKSGE